MSERKAFILTPPTQARRVYLCQDQTYFNVNGYGVSRKMLLRLGYKVEAEAPDMVRFTRAIKDAVAYEDRLAVVEAAWTVVLADGARAQEENALMRLIASLLGVSDVDSARARQQVTRE